MSKKITIYTTTNCAYCPVVKKWLDSKGQKYDVINLDEQSPNVRQQVIDMSGAMTVPITVFEEQENRNIVVGWNPGQLAAAIR